MITDTAILLTIADQRSTINDYQNEVARLTAALNDRSRNDMDTDTVMAELHAKLEAATEAIHNLEKRVAVLQQENDELTGNLAERDQQLADAQAPKKKASTRSN